MASRDDLLVTLRANTRPMETSFRGSLRRISTGLDNFSRTGTLLLTAPLAAFAAFSVKAAADFEETRNKFNAVFKGMADDARKWSDDYSEAINRSSRSTQGFLADVQNVSSQIFDTNDAATQMSFIMTQLANDLASFNNRDTADVIRAITAAMTGEFESLKAYGIVIKQIDIDNKLLELGFIKTGAAATQESKALAALSLIIKSTSDANRDAEKTSQSFRNQVEGLKDDFYDLQVELGEELIPLLRGVVEGLGDTADAWFDLDDAQKRAVFTMIVAIGVLPIVARVAQIAAAGIILLTAALKALYIGLQAFGKGSLIRRGISGIIGGVKRARDYFRRDQFYRDQGRYNRDDAIREATDKFGKRGDNYSSYSDKELQRMLDTYYGPGPGIGLGVGAGAAALGIDKLIEWYDRINEAIAKPAINLSGELREGLEQASTLWEDFVNGANRKTDELDTDGVAEFSDTTSEMQDKITERAKRLGIENQAFQELDAVNNEILEETDTARNFLEESRQAADSFQDSFSASVGNAFADAIIAGEDFGEAIENVFRQAAHDITSQLVGILVNYGLQASSGGFGNYVAGQPGSTTTTPGYPGTYNQPGRARGGPVFPGGSYLVGENGPELFRPNRAGMIDNGRNGSMHMSGGRPTVVNNYNYNLEVDTPNRIAAREAVIELLPQIQQAVAGSIQEEQRR